MKDILFAVMLLAAMTTRAWANCNTPVTCGHGKDFTAWIRFEQCPAPKDIVGAVDQALDSVRGSRGLIIDLRQAGGFSLDDARKIFGRFMNETQDWFKKRGLEPRGPWQYASPIVILVGAQSHWPVQVFAEYLNHLEYSLIVGEPVPPPSAQDSTDWEAGISPDYVVNTARSNTADAVWDEGLRRLKGLMRKHDGQHRFRMESMFHGRHG
jgi:hypothetical protein